MKRRGRTFTRGTPARWHGQPTEHTRERVESREEPLGAQTDTKATAPLAPCREELKGLKTQEPPFGARAACSAE